MNFELVDNLFQVIVLGTGAIGATLSALFLRKRELVILAMAYACFAMGTTYWVLHIAITGDFPRAFYVAEFSWIASYFFYLSLQIYRNRGEKVGFSLQAALGTFLVGISAAKFRFMGASYLLSAIFSFTLLGIFYLSAWQRKKRGRFSSVDGVMMWMIVLQAALYVSSYFMTDFSRFNLYFAIDVMLTCTAVSLLPLILREVKES